jgi:Cu+-exporting ATPase
MHPEVRQKGPSACPKCGMALEPLKVPAEEGPSVELIDMNRRFWVSLPLTVPVFALATGEIFTPALVVVAGLSATTLLWTQLALSAPDGNTRENGNLERRAQPQDVGPTHTKAGRAN